MTKVFNKGDLVSWQHPSAAEEKDTGVVVRMGTTSDPDDNYSVLVKWDSDSQIRFCCVQDTYLVCRAQEVCSEKITEEKAVMFLLSIGYTVSKK